MDCWQQLGIEALRQGNHQVVEKSAQMTKDFDRLSFLYLITGNTGKLRKMLRIAEIRNDVMARFHNALYLGDVKERVRVLESSGQVYLAHLTAVTHGLDDEVARLAPLVETLELPTPTAADGAKLLQPPTPIMRTRDGSEKGETPETANVNWPLLTVPKSAFEGTLAETADTLADEEFSEPAGGAWGDEDLIMDDEGGLGVPAPAGGAADGLEAREGGGWEEDLDFGDEELDFGGPAAKGAAAGGGPADGDFFVAPQAGTRAATHWVNNSSHAADHVAAGSFESAMQLLNRQIAVVNFSPLKSKFVGVFCAANTAVPGLPLSPSLLLPLQRSSAAAAAEAKSLPAISAKLPWLIDTLKLAYKNFHLGNFNESLDLFKSIMYTVPLVVTGSRSEGNEVKELLDITREYVTAIRLKLAMTAADDPVRLTELWAYFTHCNLQPAHLLLALKSAMINAFKIKNYITAASFAHRLLGLPDVSSEKNADLKLKAQKVVHKSEQMARNEHQLQYDESNPFDIDCAGFLPIYRGSPVVKCAYCMSAFPPEHANKLCETCGLSLVGVETIGLVMRV